MSRGPEAKVKEDHKALLSELASWWFMPVQTGYGQSGIPDFLCCINGKFVGIETKAPGKKPTKFQAFQIKQINGAGGLAFYSDSVEYTREMLKAGGIL